MLLVVQALLQSLHWHPVWLAQIMLHRLGSQFSEGLLTFLRFRDLRLRLGLLGLLSRLVLFLDLLNRLLSLGQFLLEDLDDILWVSLGRVVLDEGRLEGTRLS